MGYYSGKDFPEMLADLDTADKALVAGRQLTAWVTAFTAQTSQRSASVRGGVHGLEADWQDAAGAAFAARWVIAEASVDPWMRWQPPNIDPLAAQVVETRTTVLLAQQAYRQSQQQLATLTNPDSSVMERMQAAEPGYAQGALIAGEAAKARAAAAMDALSDAFATAGQGIQDGIPKSPWTGPTGDAGSVPPGAQRSSPAAAGPGGGPLGGPGGGPGGPSASGPAGAGDQLTGASAGAGTGDAAAAAADGGTGGGAGGPGGGAGGPGGGAGGAGGGGLPTDGGGTGLAGTTTPTTPTTPTVPTYPTGPGNLGKLPPSLPMLPPGGIPLPPMATTTPKDFKGLKPGPGLIGPGLGKGGLGGGALGGGGLGSSGLGGSGLGGTGLGGTGLGGGKSGFGGLDLGRGVGGDNGTNAPAQAARQMPSRPLPAMPEAPIASAGTSAGSAAAPAPGSTPPPMMPPMGMGANGNSPRPGTAQPSGPTKGRPANRLPGVPPRLLGRSGKADPTSGIGAFGTAAAASSRRRSERTEPLETVQLLDEELWAVDGTPDSTTPTRRKGLPAR